MNNCFDYIRFILFLIAIQILKIFPVLWRCHIGGCAMRLASPWLFEQRKRADSNLRLIYPEMRARKRKAIQRKMFYNIGYVLIAFIYGKSYKKKLEYFHVAGPGLNVLRQCKKQNKAAIILSAHLGHWETFRYILATEGMSTGGDLSPVSQSLY